jgi:hypothetical protein
VREMARCRFLIHGIHSAPGDNRRGTRRLSRCHECALSRRHVGTPQRPIRTTNCLRMQSRLHDPPLRFSSRSKSAGHGHRAGDLQDKERTCDYSSNFA